jgi:hypothetical protein
MPDPLTDRLTTLPTLDKVAICKLWEELFHAPAPPRLRRDLMLRILSYRIQEQAYGSLGQRSLARLRELARRIETHSDSMAHSAPTIKPGTRLVRQWRSETHVVQVEEQGYQYKDSRYNSLSEIARLITGSRRSGPLFFGLKAKRAGNSKEAA